MKIFIGADHRGFNLKNDLVEYLQNKNIRVEDLGNYALIPEDDYPDFAREVAKAVQQDDDAVGIVICGSGVGMEIMANRFDHIRCGIAMSKEQVAHSRADDAINMLAIASNYMDLPTAQECIEAFLSTSPKNIDKYLRRINKLDQKL